MRFGVSDHYQRVLLRGAAVLLVGGLAAGCSSDVMRFQDSILTGSAHPGQRSAPASQPYPGDAQLDQTHTGSIAGQRRAGLLNRVGLAPRPQGDVGGGWATASSPAPVNNPYPVQQPTYAAAAPSGQVSSGTSLAPVTRASLDSTPTGSTSQPAAPVRVPVAQEPRVETAQPVSVVAADSEGGWSRAGGTQVSVKNGETVYNLSRRFGVPADAILRANGMSSASELAAGQQIVIPTYVHSARAPVSAPDADRNVADARSSTGTRYDVPSDRTPVPGQAPDRLAVLPQQPKLKEEQAGTQTAATGGTQTGAASSGGSYTVVAGDTLSGISRKTGVSTEALKQANGLSNGLIRIGQTLVIPAGGSAPAQVVASAPKVDQTATAAVARPEAAAYTPPKQAESVIQQASLDSGPAPDATGISRMRWPVRGRVISDFGSTSRGAKNDGIDIAVPAGTPIKAAENGVVIYAGDGLKEFGNTVLVRHEDGLVTVYGHASELKVQRGQKVRRGEDIALAGMSGSAETPKLHFEVRKDSTPVNPAKHLE